MLLSRDRSVLVIVDLQERLIPAVGDAARVLRNAGILMKAAGALEVPVIVTEQYPKGLGPTVEPLRALVAGDSVIEKISFSCTGAPAFLDRLDRTGRDQIVLAGAETHVCVLQTVLSLRAAGRGVYLVADATTSRAPVSVEMGIARMRGAGTEIVTTEMVLFEWMERAGTSSFRAISALIK